MKKQRNLFGAFVVLFVLSLLGGCCGNDDKNTSASSGSSANSGQATLFQPTGEGPVLAEVNGTKIFMDEYKARMGKQSPYIRARYDSLDKKKEFLDNMIRFELLAQAAIEKGYHQDPEVIRSIKQIMTQRLMREEFENKIKRDDITDEQLKKYYQDHQAEYNKPAMRRAAHILIKIGEGMDEKAALKKAKNVLKEAKKAKDNMNEFRKLAAKFSDDTSNKNRGGDLGYFAGTDEGGPMVKAFSDAAFAMKNLNEIAGPIKTKFGYHIIRLTGKRDKIERSFDQVKGQIQHRLFKENRTTLFDAFVDGLKKKAKLSIKEDLLTAYDPSGKSAKEEKTEKGKAPVKSPAKKELKVPTKAPQKADVKKDKKTK